jgi:biopolymer transport protein ExbB
MDLATLERQARLLGEQAVAIWIDGGWAMIAIAVTSLVLFGLGMHVWLRLLRKGFQRVPERTWRRWIDQPQERRGKIGRLIASVTVGGSIAETRSAFAELRANELTPFERDLRVMKVCVSAAPLLGLLGTVTGMLATFGALASGSGGEKTMAMVASGISEALITTETGLVIALPGLFFQYQLSRRHQRYRAFLAHLETVCTQAIHRGSRQAAPAS